MTTWIIMLEARISEADAGLDRFHSSRAALTPPDLSLIMASSRSTIP
jgi:hypothetical protein